MNPVDAGRWYTLERVEGTRSEGLVAVVTVTPDSPWFSGHFPGEPILPGIAQLSMVLETLRASSAERMRITGVRRVRFKQAVRPGETLTIHIAPNGKSPASHSFLIKIDNEIACSGTLIAEAIDSPPSAFP